MGILLYYPVKYEMAENIYWGLVGGSPMPNIGVLSHKQSIEAHWTFPPINIPDMRGLYRFGTQNLTRHVR